MAALVAARRPELVSSVSLLNATPVWGLNLPGWDGALPPPAIPRAVGRFLFDRIRDENVIGTYLRSAYANHEAVGDLARQIRSATEGRGGHAAFASILWSPPALFPRGTFASVLEDLECDALLLFGTDDPWCKPSLAGAMLRVLEGRDGGVQRYVELSRVGHCPNHEAPTAVAHVLTRWIHASSRRDPDLIENDVVRETWGEVEICEPHPHALKDGFFNEFLARRLISN